MSSSLRCGTTCRCGLVLFADLGGSVSFLGVPSISYEASAGGQASDCVGRGLLGTSTGCHGSGRTLGAES